VGRGKRPLGRAAFAGRSLTTKVALFELHYSEPPVDYNVVHILDTEDVLDYGGTGWGATFCGAYPDDDPEAGLSGSDAEIEAGHPVCPECVRVALELQERSIYLDATYWEAFVWDKDAERWVVGDLIRGRLAAPQQPHVRGRRLGGVAED
jgi:hypothetical protein